MWEKIAMGNAKLRYHIVLIQDECDMEISSIKRFKDIKIDLGNKPNIAQDAITFLNFKNREELQSIGVKYRKIIIV